MSARYRLSGRLRLDLVDERLWVDDQPVALGANAFALLRELMESPQALRTKGELLDAVWGERDVGESVLTTAVKDLRRAIGDDARNPAIIGTVHGQGYRFMAPVTAADDVARDNATATRGWTTRRALVAGALGVGVLGAGALGLAVALRPRRAPAADKSIVVLPFRDESQGRDQQWLADGLTEEILTSLARTPDLRVVSQRASERFRATEQTPADVARGLSAAHVLEGGVRRADGRLRVRINLILAADGTYLWSKTYDEKAEDVIAVEEQIAFDVARALRTILEPTRLREMLATGTRSVDAYEAYLRGLALAQQNMARGDLSYARESADAFERARTLDPGFARAHWLAAQSWSGNATRMDAAARGDVPDAERRRQYLLRVSEAVATSRDPVERLKYEAEAALAQLQLRQAHGLLVRYLRARPRDLEAWDDMTDLGAYVGEREWVSRAAEIIHRASMQDGLPQSRAITASVHAQDIAAAARRADEQLAMRPDNATTQYQAQRAYLMAGRLDKARDALAKVSASKMTPWNRALAAMRQACAEGRTADAARQRGVIEATGQLTPRWNAAQIMGDERGVEALLRPYDTPEGLPTLVQFLVYPSFDARPYPTLRALLAREGIDRPPPLPLPFACKP